MRFLKAAVKKGRGMGLQTSLQAPYTSYDLVWASESGKTVSLEDFDILKVLGAGAFGTVLLVEEKKSKEWFAMKVIKKDLNILKQKK